MSTPLIGKLLRLKGREEEDPRQEPSQILRYVLYWGIVFTREETQSNMKKSMRHVRRRKLPPNPRNIAELGEIPEKFRSIP